jgi:integration host factor subunit beta
VRGVGVAGQTFWYAATCAVSYTTMTKADLIEEVSRTLEVPLKEGELILNTIFGGIVRSLREGDKVEIRGFGSFRTRQRKSRMGRNPKTGARVEVPAKTVPFFKASRELMERIQDSAEPNQDDEPSALK